MVILPLTYLGGTEWYRLLLNEECVVDVGENWVKQTSRNRCEIMTSGGVATLTVPVHGYGEKKAARDVRIDNTKKWQHQHWVSLVSAYRNSPFFDHYHERFHSFYTKRFEFLADLNTGLTESVLTVLGAADRLRISENYVTAAFGDIDMRGKKALKRHENSPVPAYTQVFSDRVEFVGGLSVIDLLFCESGPAARRLLSR